MVLTAVGPDFNRDEQPTHELPIPEAKAFIEMLSAVDEDLWEGVACSRVKKLSAKIINFLPIITSQNSLIKQTDVRQTQRPQSSDFVGTSVNDCRRRMYSDDEINELLQKERANAASEMQAMKAEMEKNMEKKMEEKLAAMLAGMTGANAGFSVVPPSESSNNLGEDVGGDDAVNLGGDDDVNLGGDI